MCRLANTTNMDITDKMLSNFQTQREKSFVLILDDKNINLYLCIIV